MRDGKLTILFTSDLHAHLFPTDYISREEQDLGLFKCANRFAKDGDTLLIDGGDLLQGSPLGAFCHDEGAGAEVFARVMNRCGYDYVTLGNHDFNYGTRYLKAYLDHLDGQCLCENVLREDLGAAAYPACVRTLACGLRIGLVGVVTDHVNMWEKPEHLAGFRITDPVEAARRALDGLRDQVDLTVCVYHGGFEKDLDTGATLSATTENMAYRICQELDFDILLTGHQHMSVAGRDLLGTFVVQPLDSGREFVRVEAVVSGGKKRFASRHLPAGGPCDKALTDEFAPLEQGAQTWLDQVVGHLSRPLRRELPLTMARDTSPLADFFNMVQQTASGAELSAASLANDAAGLPQVVRRRDVLTAYPYTNTLVVVRVTGKILREAMEHSAAYFDLDAEGRLIISRRFLQPKVEHYNYDYFAGVRYEIDASRPVGQRITRLTRQGRAVEDSDTFTLCLNSYRASGAGGYDCYGGCPVVKEINREFSDVMLAFFQEHPEVAVSSAPAYRVTGEKEA